MIKNFVRFGQILLHNMRMLKQVLLFAWKISFLLQLCIFLYKTYYNIFLYNFFITGYFLLAKFLIVFEGFLPDRLFYMKHKICFYSYHCCHLTYHQIIQHNKINQIISHDFSLLKRTF